MSDGQTDLFSHWGARAHPIAQATVDHMAVDTASLDDATLINSIPSATLAAASALAKEAVRRNLSSASPALGQLCRSFAGYGMDRAVPEQVASLQALAALGGQEAAHIVADVIAKGVVQGPTLRVAVESAARLKSVLDPALLVKLLHDPDPWIRAATCGCIRPSADAIPILVDLLDDLNQNVGVAAACALGRMGRLESRPALLRLLLVEPTAEVIDAITVVADEEAIVILGRIGRDVPALAQIALDALDAIDHPLARRVVERMIKPAPMRADR